MEISSYMFEKNDQDAIFAPKIQKIPAANTHVCVEIKKARRFKPGFSRGARQILLIAAAFRP